MLSTPDSDKGILSVLSEDFPSGLNPYAVLAAKLGITEELLLARIKNLLSENKIRRLGATLNHRTVGYTANALTVWSVPADKIEVFAKAAAARPEISHCYQRKSYPHWPYNLYTVIHSHSREACQQTAGELAKALNIKDYQLLFSVREFKKSRLKF